MDGVMGNRIVVQLAPLFRLFEIIGLRHNERELMNRIAAMRSAVTLRAGLRVHRVPEDAYQSPVSLIISKVRFRDRPGLRTVLDGPGIRAVPVFVQTYGVAEGNDITLMTDERQMVGRVTTPERIAFLIPEPISPRPELALAGRSLPGYIHLRRVAGEGLSTERTFLINRILVGTEMNRIEILEGVADEEDERHRRVTTRL